MEIKDIDKLIEKVKQYPNYIMILSDMSGYSKSYVKKLMAGERKLTLEFAQNLCEVAKAMDLKKKRIENEIAKSIQPLAQESH